jgi:hypothetical protein
MFKALLFLPLLASCLFIFSTLKHLPFVTLLLFSTPFYTPLLPRHDPEQLTTIGKETIQALLSDGLIALGDILYSYESMQDVKESGGDPK